jgi:MarR family transcriptional regulator for hemolysin
MSVSSDRLTPPHHLKLMIEVSLIVRFWRSLMDDQLRALGITHVHGTILWWIAESRKMLSQTELARKLGIETSTLVRQLDVLEKGGLVARETISDRRIRLIKLTDEGASVVKRNREISERLSGDLLDGIGSDAVEQCADLMHELRIRLQADREDPLAEPATKAE